MALRRSKPMLIRPKGVCDAQDGTNTFAGAMQTLTNLIPSPTTLGVFAPRPAALLLTNFSTFTVPAGLTALCVIGSRVYGMISSSLHGGKDQPFIYDLLSNAFIAISGITNANLPTTQPTTGDWVPPVMVPITATKILVTHVGFSGSSSNFFGVIDITTFASPVWSGANTATHALPAVPISVAQFNGRAWLAVANAVYFTDALDPLTITNASQVIVLGDNQPVTALSGLPLTNQLVGGQVQSLIVFKGAEVMYQVTGDQATTNLAVNEMNVLTGTLAPNTIVPTPQGTFFVAPDGLRMINQQGVIGEPIGANGSGINLPFLNAINPTRMCAAFNENTLRVSVQNGTLSSQPYQEYWYNLNLKIWTGPHSLASSLMAPAYVGASSFIAAATGVNAALFGGRVNPLANSTYTENGVALTWTFQTVLLPDNQQMAMNKVVQTSLMTQLPAGQAISLQAIDETGNILNTFSIQAPNTNPAIWGSFTWGTGIWGSITGYLKQYFIAWTAPLVFKQMSVMVTGASQAGFSIGNLYLRHQILGYLLPY